MSWGLALHVLVSAPSDGIPRFCDRKEELSTKRSIETQTAVFACPVRRKRFLMDARGISRFGTPLPIHLLYCFVLYTPSPRSPAVYTRGPQSLVLEEIGQTNNNKEFGFVLLIGSRAPIISRFCFEMTLQISERASARTRSGCGRSNPPHTSKRL